MAFALFAQVLFPFTADAQNQYLQDWTFHTDSVEDAINNHRVHHNELAQTLISGWEHNGDSIAIFKVDSSGNQIWHKKYQIAPGNNGFFSSAHIASDSDYNYYLTTLKYIFKIDSAGNILQSEFDTIQDHLFTFPSSRSSLIASTSDHFYVIKKFDNTITNGFYNRVYLTKYDHQLQVIWSRWITHGQSSYFYYSKTDASGNIHCIYQSTGGPFAPWLYSYRISFKPNGDTLYFHALENGQNQIPASSIDDFNNSLIARSDDTGGSSLNDICLSKYDTSGIMLWSDTIYGGTTTYERPTAVYGDSNHNTYLLSYISANGFNFKGEIKLRKYDSAGQLIRIQSWSGTDTIHGGWNYATNLKVTNASDLYILGSISNIGKLGDAILVKSDTSGNTLWSAQFAVGDSIRDCFYHLEKDNCGNLYTTVLTDSSSVIMSYVNLVRFITEIPCFVSDSEVPEKSSSALIYPNPATSQIRIRRPEGTNREPIYLYDILGKNILTIKSSITKQPSEEMLQDVSALPRGIYLATDNHGFFVKLILQ